MTDDPRVGAAAKTLYEARWKSGSNLSMNVYRDQARAALAAADEAMPTVGLPDELAAILRDQSSVVPQDAGVFALIAKWANAPANTASADEAVPLPELRMAPMMPMSPEAIARRFHEVYEELAPVYGWQTQERSAVPWDDVPPENKRVMVKTVTRLIHEGALVHEKLWQARGEFIDGLSKLQARETKRAEKAEAAVRELTEALREALSFKACCAFADSEQVLARAREVLVKYD